MPDAQIYVQDYLRSEKSLRPQSTSHSIARRHSAPKLGNPTPLGLSAFATSVFILSFYECQLFGVTIPHVAVGVSMFTGGVVQFAAGMWEFKVGNTFGGTGFSAFGGFWASYGALYIPAFGIVDAYKGFDSQYHSALAVYNLAWLIFTVIFTLACIRTNLGVLSAFVFLSLDFLSATVYYFTMVGFFQTLGGIFGIITSAIVWYCLAATLLTPDLSPISLPVWDLSSKSA